jgi:hypothetical protein
MSNSTSICNLLILTLDLLKIRGVKKGETP